MRRLLAAMALATLVPDLAGCPLVTAILQRPGAATEGFQARLLELSDHLQAMFFDTGVQREKAAADADRALEMWMDLYVDHYLTPPPGFQDIPRWQEIMDSVAGPLQRIGRYAREGKALEGHHQLRLLQDSLTEFYGALPTRKAAGLGPVVHTLETLQFIRGGGRNATLERRARLRLLADRFTEWRAGPGKSAPQDSVASFAQDLQALLDLSEQREAAIADGAKALLERTDELVRAGVAGQWRVRLEDPVPETSSAPDHLAH